MTFSLNVIEPTLTGQAGHCFSFIDSLCSAAGSPPLTLWCGRNASISLPAHVSIKRFFYRKIRRIQALWLYRKLLRSGERIFISTAGRTDLMLLNLASLTRIPAQQVFLYVHWFKSSDSKFRQLAKLAKSQPNLVILTPSATVREEFLKAGFVNTQIVPYPITPCKQPLHAVESNQFRHLLFAGAARKDKGFSSVVDLVQLLTAEKSNIPVTMQTSAEHYDKLDEVTRNDIARLEACNYPWLQKYSETLPQPEYLELFQGSICIQLYSQQDFADRISGVTLDALSAGSPIVTLSGTWMARVVDEFKAGIVLDFPETGLVHDAVKTIKQDYGTYQQNALKAGYELQLRHSAGHLMQVLTS